MIVHNGDHAEFEIEHANTKPEDRPDWPLPSFDANDWAKAFMAQFDGEQAIRIDLDLIRAWFANALMRGFDEANSRRTVQQKPAHTHGALGITDCFICNPDNPSPVKNTDR